MKLIQCPCCDYFTLPKGKDYEICPIMRDTNVGSELIPAMNAASAATKDYVRKTAVLGVSCVKRKLADLLTALTGQPLKYFDDMESAKKWLIEE